MRTIAATFDTKAEAEAASRALAGIGLSRERIVLKDVAPTADAPGGAVFLSAKVNSEQVEAATEILKRRWTENDGGQSFARQSDNRAADPPPTAEAPRIAEAPITAEPPPRPALRHGSEFESGAAPQRPEPQRPAPQQRAAKADQTKFGRYLIYYGLALVAAFMIGAWLGMLD